MLQQPPKRNPQQETGAAGSSQSATRRTLTSLSGSTRFEALSFAANNTIRATGSH